MPLLFHGQVLAAELDDELLHGATCSFLLEGAAVAVVVVVLVEVLESLKSLMSAQWAGFDSPARGPRFHGTPGSFGCSSFRLVLCLSPSLEIFVFLSGRIHWSRTDRCGRSGSLAMTASGCSGFGVSSSSDADKSTSTTLPWGADVPPGSE